MGDSDARITRIEMPDGTEVWARISGAEELARPGSGPSFTDIGAGNITDRVQARVESLQGVVTSVARSLAEPLRSVRPDEVSVEFGIELTAKSGKVVGLLADGEAKGSIKVTLTWNGGGPPLDPPPPAQGPGQPATPVPFVPPPAPSAPPLIAPPASPAPSAPSTPAASTMRPGGAAATDPAAGASTGAPAHAGGTAPDDGSGS
ncbi:CU044_2847 family protein [Streptomyces sp. NPDC127117]|uniref:CU044_2847 family protein n=1 Tax=Streptomyces sp. NPDC127117 TaxID=3345368 RepID=UPI00363C1531